MNFTIGTYGNSLFSSTKGKIAWITECISKPRSLNELCRFSLIRKIVPILKSRLDFSDADMSGFIEFAVYLSMMQIDISNPDNHPYIKFKVGGYNGRNLKLVEAVILLDLVQLINIYNWSDPTREIVDYKFKTPLFNEINSAKFKFENLYPSDVLYNLRLIFRDKGRKNYKFLSLIYSDFLDIYKKIYPDDQMPNITLYHLVYDELDKMLDDFSYGVFGFDIGIKSCFFITLFKVAGLYIDDSYILNNIYYYFINEFRKLWWNCDLYAKYSDQIKIEKDYYGVFLTIDRFQIEQRVKGVYIDLEPSDTYLRKDIHVNVIKDVDTDHKDSLDTEKELFNSMDTEISDENKLFQYMPVNFSDDVKRQVLDEIKNMARGLNGTLFAKVIYAALQNNVFNKKPQYELLVSTGIKEVEKGRSNYYRSLNVLATNYKIDIEIDAFTQKCDRDIKELLEKIKEKDL